MQFLQLRVQDLKFLDVLYVWVTKLKYLKVLLYSQHLQETLIID